MGSSIAAIGERISVNGRPATFCYFIPPGAAAVRYDGEQGTRVVPIQRIKVQRDFSG